ncbi:Dynamin stalk domain [Dillenia turbinata]|uniref:Dynamin stalk domain n=1 Tax=Dillenia turbinata TaxID=194707 RepID=A0AAN8WFI7_9MAGN
MAVAPIVSSYNDKIRPLLDAVDKLRYLKVMEEGIQLPTIVVVGDQSSGKSSVLESLAGISLPRGQGICTRVPLIMRLQNHSVSETELSLEFNGKTLQTDETRIIEDIVAATDEIAGNGKGISHAPLTLLVKKQGVPDLTMVDLPGITRVPVKGQPEDIYEQISNIIFQYIQPKESIILNVLSATVDFSTCESIRMSQRVDRTGERTLAVVTKADKAPEGLLEKVTADDVNIGLGYVCVRNRVGDETYEEARVEEAKLFESHPLLSKIDKSIVGIPVLAQKLVQIQAMSISRSLPDIVKTINLKLSNNVSELNKMPQNLSSIAEAMTAFMRIIGLVKESLRKVLIRGEYDEYPDEENMHCAARLAEMLNQFYDDLHSSRNEFHHAGDFLMEEIRILEETKSIGLPNFLPRTAFLAILQRHMKTISGAPITFVRAVWTFVGDVVIRVLMFHSENYPQLQSSMRRAANGLISKVMENSVDHVIEIVEMEKMTDYTCNPNYMTCWNKLMCQLDMFLEVVGDVYKGNKVKLEVFGEVEIGHLRKHGSVVREAFDLKMRMTAYWKIVLRRLVDGLALHLLFSLDKLVNRDMEMEIVSEMMGPTGGGIEHMLEESPSVVEKRKRLNKSIKLLKDSELVLTRIMDRIHLLD